MGSEFKSRTLSFNRAAAGGYELSPFSCDYVRKQVNTEGYVFVKGFGQDAPHVLEEKLLALGAPLGKPVRYENEGSNGFISDITPSRAVFSGETSYKSANEFEFHTDGSYYDNPPAYVGIACVRPDPKGDGKTRLSFIRNALGFLTPEQIAELNKPNFKFSRPNRAGDNTQESYRLQSILKPGIGNYFLRFRSDTVLPQTPEALDAFQSLAAAFKKTAVEFLVPANALLMIDNRTTVHARTNFTPNYDLEDRLLKRAYFTPALEG